MNATCKTCPFWDASPADRPNCGARECHVRSPAAFTVRVAPERGESPRDSERNARWPWTEPDNWCGEHPALQRDRLAAMAMQAMLSNPSLRPTKGGANLGPKDVAEGAYQIADAIVALLGGAA